MSDPLSCIYQSGGPRAGIRRGGVSRPQEFHPRPLAEPDVSLSTHPAPILQPLAHIPASSARKPPETSAQVARELAEPDVCTCASASWNVVRLAHWATLLPFARLMSHHAGMTQPLRSATITAASSLLRAAPPLGGASRLSASPFELVPFALHRHRRFPQFNVRARIRLTRPLCRTPLGPSAGNGQTDRGATSLPGFDVL